MESKMKKKARPTRHPKQARFTWLRMCVQYEATQELLTWWKKLPHNKKRAELLVSYSAWGEEADDFLMSKSKTRPKYQKQYDAAFDGTFDGVEHNEESPGDDLESAYDDAMAIAYGLCTNNVDW